jgi:hypothetical protein
MQGRQYSRRQLFEETEKSELQSLPLYRYELKRKKIVTVMKNNHICLGEDKHYYSVPYKYVGKKVTVLYNQVHVQIYFRYDCIASHGRNRKMYGYTTDADHLASHHRYQGDWSPEKFIEKAGAIGEETMKYISAILIRKQHPEQTYKSCQGIISYAFKVGNDRLNNACQRASFYQDYSYKTIKTILEKKLDLIPLDTDSQVIMMPAHENIRGEAYYK